MPMKSAISAVALFLLLGTFAPAYAQREQEEQGKPQQGRQHQEEKPAQQQQPANRPAQQSQGQQRQQSNPTTVSFSQTDEISKRLGLANSSGLSGRTSSSGTEIARFQRGENI